MIVNNVSGALLLDKKSTLPQQDYRHRQKRKLLDVVIANFTQHQNDNNDKSRLGEKKANFFNDNDKTQKRTNVLQR